MGKMEYQEKMLRDILLQYELKNPHTDVLQHHGNLVVRVQTANAVYVLRVYEQATSPERIQEELEWLVALQRDTDLAVPSPVTNREKTLITPWIGHGVSILHYAVLFNWVDGNPVSQYLSQEICAAIGTLIARLHRHAQSYTRPQNTAFVGACYNLDWLIGPTSWWSSGQAKRVLGGDTYTRLLPAIEIAADVMRRLGESHDHFGIIHADLHLDNILVANHRYAVIDFSDCAFGYYFFDLALTEQAFRNRAADQRCLTVFREHYCREGGIAALPLEEIDAFMIPIGVVFLEWVLSSDNPEIRSLMLPRVPTTIEQILVSAERAKRMT